MAEPIHRPGKNEGASSERANLLGENTDSDEEFVLGATGRDSSSTNKMKDVKLQVEEITNIMKENVNKLFTRGDRLEDLDARSENLRSASSDFHAASSRLRKNMWWKEMRTRLIIGILITLLLITIIVWLAVKYS